MKLRSIGRALAMAALVAAMIGVVTGVGFTDVTTNKTLYQPGDTVYITGGGMQPGEQVADTIYNPDGSLASLNEVKADAYGKFSDKYVLPSDAPSGIYTVVAVGETSGNQYTTTFDPGSGDQSLGAGALDCQLTPYNPTHYALPVSTGSIETNDYAPDTVTCTIDGANDVPTDEITNGTVNVFIKHSSFDVNGENNEVVLGTISGTTITFSYTAPTAPPACETSIVAYGDVGRNSNNSLIPHPGQNTATAGFAFVVNSTDAAAIACGGGGGQGGLDLTVEKTANASFKRTFHWDIAKSSNKDLVKQVGGTATFNYTVTVTRTGSTDSGWTVNGTITVTNPNDQAASSVSVADAVNDANTVNCTIENGGAIGTLAAGAFKSLMYSCSWGQAPSSTSETNTATATWNPTLGGGKVTPDSSGTGTADFAFDTPTLTDDCVDVSDAIDGGLSTGLGTVCSTGNQTTTFSASGAFSVPQFGCQDHTNIATIKTNTSGTTRDASKKVTVCGPARTGALTMGFWQNKNGQAIIASYSGANCQALRTWLNGYNPFADLAATTCTGVQGYVTNVIKAANASGASMNAMLKAQMLATALDVYFGGGPGGNRINAPSPVGGQLIDLTQICKPILSGPSCGGYEDTSSSFGGASRTVSQMLSDAASQSNAGGSIWYGQVKTGPGSQELAKDAFDAVNNQVAFSA